LAFVTEADGIRCSQMESCMLTPFPLAGCVVGDAPVLPGEPKRFVCILQRGLEGRDPTGFRVIGHYAAFRECNRVIEHLGEVVVKATRAERDKSTAAAVLAHPLRVRILALANERDMSPVEFCREGLAPEEMDVSHVAYHFRELADYGCLEVVEENKRRGSIEHVYRGIGRAYFSEADWHRLTPDDRERLSKTVVQGLFARADAAMMAKTFDARDDRHLTWTAMRLDEQGWAELMTALSAAFGEVEQIRQDAERRLGESGQSGFTATSAILGFESPTIPPRAETAE
jgi:hypothetical protein